MNTDCQGSNPRRRSLEATAPALAVHRLWGDAAQNIVDYLLRRSESFSTWLKRDRHRRALDRLGDHTLKDIGLARVDLDRGWHRLL